jgi:hypothetical protein
MPPSECLRAFAIAVTAVEQSGGDPRLQIVAYRSYNTVTILIKKATFTSGELESIREFSKERAFDLIYAPDIRPDETNLYNILPESVYYTTFMGLLHTQPHESFYESYPYDINPPTDDKPFYSHFFKWSQTRQVIEELGRVWQPFGGAGYFVIVGLFGLALLLSISIIVLPITIVRYRAFDNRAREAGIQFNNQPTFLVLFYFGLIGFAYLLVEIPLIQQFILYLDHPTYAMTTVLSSLLLFSGLGSQFSHRISLRFALVILVILIISYPFILPTLFSSTLGLQFPLRIILAALVLVPIGFLMGIPFPGGILRLLEGRGIPWIWAVNGSASVVAAILAALLSLSFGFSLVLKIGAICYVGGWFITLTRPTRFPPQ